MKIQWRAGMSSGLNTAWALGKVLFPVTFVVSVLRHTPVIDWAVTLFEPLMKWIGLSGQAAIPLVLGNFINLYAAIGGILTMEFSVKEVFILAIMLSFSHNLFVEGAVCKKVGVSIWLMSFIRLFMAFGSAFIINIVWQGGEHVAQYGLVSVHDVTVSGFWAIVGYGLKTAITGTLQFSIVVFLVMMFIQVLKDLRILTRFSRKLEATMNYLGIPSRGAVTMTAGLLFGIAFGAGVIIDQAREQDFSKRDLYIMLIFLSGCHAVIEDTLIFIPLGISLFALLLIRVFVAVILTIAVARIWRRRGFKPIHVEG